ncbi:MAG: putative lipid II flippase FtsW [Alphaproteobacteria bacterium]
MTIWSRTDTSLLSRWWWTVDRFTLFAVLALIFFGLVLNLSASPAIAARHHLPSLHFFYRQIVFVGPAIALMVALSLVPPDALRQRTPLILLVCYLLLLSTLVLGGDVNGARRWLSIGGFKLQPSEFLKPFFVILLAMILNDESRSPPWKRYGVATGLLALVIVPLAMQPDYGQTALIVAVWGMMMFLGGLPWYVLGAAGVAIAGGAYYVYTHVQHVAERVNGFINPNAADTYQVQTALRAFHTGGPFGRGIGEGRVKWDLPDAHTDFIFAVAGEEFGLIVCLGVVALFAFIVFRGFARAMKEPNHFVQLAATGLAMLLALQAFINLGVNVHILPAKGMTLPFVSYGGSSLLAVSVTLGLLLALTRRRIRGGFPKTIPLKRSVQ